MRILILCDHFGTGGGAGTIARLQAEELSKTHAVHVLTAHLPKQFSIFNFQFSIKEFNLDYNPLLRNYLGLYHPKAINILKQYLSNNQFDITITHNVFYNWSYASLDILAEYKIKTIHVFHDVSSFTNNTKLANIPFTKNRSEYIFDYHYPEWKRVREWWGGIYNPLRQILIKKHLSNATKTVAVSRALADALRQNNIRVDAVVHNGLPTNIHQEATSYKLQATNNILMIGRMNTAKGFLQAVEYLAHLKNRHNFTPELRIAGNQDISKDVTAQKIIARAKTLGVVDQIIFLGWLEKETYKSELASCGLLIVPSVCFDSFPTVVLEAMQYAKPVVATIFGGSREIVEHGVTGFIEDPFDVPKFSERIRELLTDQDKNHHFGEAGLRRLKQEFSLERQTQVLLSLL